MRNINEVGARLWLELLSIPEQPQGEYGQFRTGSSLKMGGTPLSDPDQVMIAQSLGQLFAGLADQRSNSVSSIGNGCTTIAGNGNVLRSRANFSVPAGNGNAHFTSLSSAVPVGNGNARTTSTDNLVRVGNGIPAPAHGRTAPAL